MRGFTACMLITAGLAGCATVDYQPYEGRTNAYEGQGGTKLVVDGIDFWANGAPPRRYAVVGVANAKVGDGIGAADRQRSAVAAKAKEVGAQAAIELATATTGTGVIRTAPNIYAGTRRRDTQYQLIRYLD